MVASQGKNKSDFCGLCTHIWLVILGFCSNAAAADDILWKIVLHCV